MPENGIANTIYISVSYDKHIYLIETPFSINKENWDITKQRPVNIYLKEYKKLNTQLDFLKIEVREMIENLETEKVKITKKILSEKIQTICKEGKRNLPENSILFHMNEYIQGKKETLVKSTYKRYKVFFNLLQRFEGFQGKRLYVNKLDTNFVNDFHEFCLEENYNESTFRRTVYFVRTILNHLEENGIETSLRNIKLRKNILQKEIITLSESELNQIKSAKISPELETSRDWLLISCYTGQQIADFMKFTASQLCKINGINCIYFVQQKTNKKITLPLHPVVQEIIDRNHNNFPPKISANQYNSDIKEVAKLAGIKQITKGSKRTGHRAENLVTEKWELITSQVGRQSFAANFYGKIPISLLIMATGHSSEDAFLKYINADNHEKVVLLNKYFQAETPLPLSNVI